MFDFLSDPWVRELAIRTLAATAVFAAILVVSWPYLSRDGFDTRMRRVVRERERLRLRERARLEAANPVMNIRRRPRKFYSDIVAALGLDQAKIGPAIPLLLQNAGYRGDAAVVTFLAARIITPLAMVAVAIFYIFVVLDLQKPLVLKLLMVAAAGGLGYFLPTIYVKNKKTKRQQSIGRAWPDALDLLLICVESGMAIDPALQKVSVEIGAGSVHLAEELAVTAGELSFLPDRRTAYENLAERTGLESVKSIVAALKQAEKYGTSLGRSLRVLAQETRNERLSLAEKKAAGLPPKLTVPMIIFFLPVLFVVIMTPAGIQIAST